MIDGGEDGFWLKVGCMYGLLSIKSGYLVIVLVDAPGMER